MNTPPLPCARTCTLPSVIAAEADFFASAFYAQERLSPSQKDSFRFETIIERRERLSRELAEWLQGKVAYGPFKGLDLDPEMSWSQAALSSMLLGCYELEVMNAIHSQEFAERTHFVDIGAADGFYAVGGLRNGRFQSADVFELTQSGREKIRRNAERNGVLNQMRIFGAADSQLTEILAGVNWHNTILLCDIEGDEFDLFDDACLDSVNGAMILIEIHNWVTEFWNRYTALLKRAASRFELRLLERSTFPRHHMPELRGVPDDNRMLMLSEGRPNVMRFLQLVSP